MVDWVVEAWDGVTVDAVKSSFAHCGITTSDQSKFHGKLKNCLGVDDVLLPDEEATGLTDFDSDDDNSFDN